MVPCLIQQLFRMKIGIELDPEIVDGVLFPMLFKQKHGPRDLLLDIKMTQRWGKHGDSMITLPGRRFPAGAGRAALIEELGVYQPAKNRSPFTRIPPLLERTLPHIRRVALGKVTSRFRRGSTHYGDWGTVDILNELRELKHPMIECHPVPDSSRHFDLHAACCAHDLFPGDAYIRLEEMDGAELQELVVATCDLWGYLSSNRPEQVKLWLQKREKTIIKEDLQFVNHYLEHSLSNGGLYWDQHPTMTVCVWCLFRTKH